MSKPKIAELERLGVAKPCVIIPRRKYGAGGPKSHLVIPDPQVQADAPFDQCLWAGRYILERRPDVIVHLGDHAENIACSRHETNLSMEGRRVVDDLKAANEARAMFQRPVREWNKRRRKGKQYRPRWILTEGNHDKAILRIEEEFPRFQGLVPKDPYGFAGDGWEVYPFLKPVVVDGIKYLHFAPRGSRGAVTQTHRGAPDARTMVMREMMSCTAGHQQGLSVYIHQLEGRVVRGLICGSFYRHALDFLSPQGADTWRGLIVKHEVHDGAYDLMEVSIDYLERKFS